MTIAAVPANTLRHDARVITLVGIAHGVSHFSHLLLAALFPWLKPAFGLSYSELGLLMTMFFVVSGTGQALAGFVVDRVGARSVLFAGLAVLGVAALVMSAAQNYTMLMAGAMLAGLGNSVFHPADYTLLNQRVSPANLGHAFSMHGISGNLGWAAAPIFLTTIAGLSDWRTALVAASFLPFGVLLLMFLNRGVLDTGDARRKAAADAAAAGSVLAFMRIPAVWMCFAFFAISSLALGGIQSFSVASLRAVYDMSLPLATSGYIAYMLASAAGMIAGGFFAAMTKHHERIIALAFSAAGALALLLASGMVTPLMAIVLIGAMGFGSGVAGPSRDLLIRAAAPKNATGRVYGVVYSGMDIGIASAPLLFGAVMDANHPAWVFVLIGMFQVGALLTAVRVGSNNSRKAAMA